MPIGTQKTLKPKPPDKGSFPLDHEGMLQDKIALLLYMGSLLYVHVHRRMQGIHGEVPVVSEAMQ